jgi:hypothetical protein
MSKISVFVVSITMAMAFAVGCDGGGSKMVGDLADAGAMQPQTGNAGGGATTTTAPSTQPPNTQPPAESVCGDGILGQDEWCDGNELNGASCASLGYGTGTLLCSTTCIYDISMCTTDTGPTSGTGGSSGT